MEDDINADIVRHTKYLKILRKKRRMYNPCNEEYSRYGIVIKGIESVISNLEELLKT